MAEAEGVAVNQTGTDEETDPAAPPSRSRKRMTVFRGKDAPGLFESGTMSFPVFDAADQEKLKTDGPRTTNIALGGHDAVLFRGEGDEGFSLVKAWFGPHYVLPRHTHDGDCLYYVVEGSIVMGSQVLEAGDGFFVPSGAPYAYEAGPDGVVVLEFRTRTSFGMNIPGGQVERLRRMGVVADEHAEQWAELRAKVTG
jgi:quercetin dioxygenase-like cupin family protein